MDNSKSTATIERLGAYSDQDAAQLGTLFTFLSEKATGAPIDKDWLERTIASPYHVQLVARHSDGSGKIVGAATLSLIFEPLKGQVAFLEAFVVDPDTRGMGIGDLLWQAMDTWCREKNAFLEFTSRADREAAHRFYLKHGATIRETTVFRYTPAKD